MDEDLRGKKLLLLAGADVHSKVVVAAQELGVYTIVTDYLDVKDSPAKLIADEQWFLDIKDIDGIVEKCKEENVDGVLAFCIDPAQIPYQRICEKLGVPCYGTREQFKILTNKKAFKNYCIEHFVDVVPDYNLEDVENGKVEYPVLVKPSDSRGSRGQSVCYYKADIKKAVEYAREESSDGNILIEKYMLGKQDFSLAYMVIDSIPYLLKIGDRYLGTVKDNLERQQICTLLPSKSAKGYREKVETNILEMIKSMKIEFGAVFLQGFIENNRVYLYDPGMRFPGGDFDVVLKKSTGFDNMKSMVRFALTGDVSSCYGNPVNAYNLDGKTCIILSVASRPGKIFVFDGMEKIKLDDRVCSATQRYNVGDIIPSTGDLRQRVAEFVALLPNRNDVLGFIEYIYQNLKILDEFGEDMIISKMGTDILLGDEDVIC